MATFTPAQFQPESLTDQNTLQFTVNVLETHFSLDANGTRCQRRDLWQVLVTAAARASTIEATCADLASAPDSNTIRNHLNEQLAGLESDLHSLEQQCNSALASHLPPWLPAGPQKVAIDLHDEPFSGQDAPADPHCWVCRGQAQAGTTRFYRCATAYLIRRDVRLSLAVTFVPLCIPRIHCWRCCNAYWGGCACWASP